MFKTLFYVKITLGLVIGLALSLGLTSGLALAQDPIHVTTTGAGSGDGSDWANATVLTNALTIANPGDEIWVASGVYTPGTNTSDNFNLPSGVAVYGGFAGGETMLSQRSYTANVTILSGDIAGDDTNTDGNHIAETSDDIQGSNSENLIYADGQSGTPITKSTVLDGFTITAGQADDFSSPGDKGGGLFCAGSSAGSECSPTLSNLTFSGNSAFGIEGGGAMYNDGGFGGVSSPQLTNITFSGNLASSGNGGAMYNNGLGGISSPRLTNVIFSGNSASIAGGAMFNNGAFGNSSPKLTNVTISGNYSADSGGGLANEGSEGTSSPQLTNVIMWRNEADFDGNQLYNSWASPVLSYTLIQSGTNDIVNIDSTPSFGPNILTSDPLFEAPVAATAAPTSTGSYRLGSALSPAIDAGLNSAISGVSTDLDGNARIFSDTVDLGAYESTLTFTCPGSGLIYVDWNATGDNDGTSWSNAYTNLQSGLAEAEKRIDGGGCASLGEIWVASGVYTPGATVTETFSLLSGMALYGGFAGNETMRDQRSYTANVTILSGDIGGDDTNTDGNNIAETSADIQGSNSNNVIVAYGQSDLPMTSNTVLDGFTITAGQANGPQFDGGGFHCLGNFSGGDCSPSLSNIIFSGNSATTGGGAMFNTGLSGGNSSPTLVNVTFSGNSASFDGGAMYNSGLSGGNSSPTLVNVTFSGNSASFDGGAMYNDGFDGDSSPQLTNVSFGGNSASGSGGAMYNQGSIDGVSSPNLTNVIVWGNTAITGTQLYNDAASPVLSYTLIQSGTNAVVNENGGSIGYGPGILTSDPLFVDVANNNLRLQDSSPAIDSGLNSAISLPTDLGGNSRIVNSTVDMGAFENQNNGSSKIYLPTVIKE